MMEEIRLELEKKHAREQAKQERKLQTEVINVNLWWISNIAVMNIEHFVIGRTAAKTIKTTPTRFIFWWRHCGHHRIYIHRIIYEPPEFAGSYDPRAIRAYYTGYLLVPTRKAIKYGMNTTGCQNLSKSFTHTAWTSRRMIVNPLLVTAISLCLVHITVICYYSCNFTTLYI